jgi:hypothetical protein
MTIPPALNTAEAEEVKATPVICTVLAVNVLAALNTADARLVAFWERELLALNDETEFCIAFTVYEDAALRDVPAC